MVKLRYFCPGSGALPSEAEHVAGDTVGEILKRMEIHLLPLVEFSLDELTIVLDGRVAGRNSSVANGQELLILKPTSGG